MSDLVKDGKNVSKEGEKKVVHDPFELLRKRMNAGKASRTNKSVYLVLDGSGSMSGTKWDAVCNVAADVERQYGGKVLFTKLVFDDSVAMREVLSQYCPGGGTNIKAGLSAVDSPGCHAVLMSDGGQTAEDARDEIPRLVASNIVVHTVFAGKDYDGANLLREIAAATGGKFMHVGAVGQEIFDAINALVSKAVAALNGAPKNAIEMGGGENG